MIFKKLKNNKNRGNGLKIDKRYKNLFFNSLQYIIGVFSVFIVYRF